MAEPVDGPIVVDTDIGGDPDDAVAVAMAALDVPQLAMVTTSDEVSGRRARLARYLLDLCGRPDVRVVAGRDLGHHHLLSDALVPVGVPSLPDDLATVAEFCRVAPGPVRWVSLGPLSNLAALLTACPDLAGRLDVTVMAGSRARPVPACAASDYRCVHRAEPERAEFNVRADIGAARTVLTTARRPRVVTFDVTSDPAIEFSAGGSIHRRLAAPSSPPWAHLIANGMDAWFREKRPATAQHDPLALSLALGYPFVETAPHMLRVDERGLLRDDPHGTGVLLSVRADYSGFLDWLTGRLDVHLSAHR